MGALSIGHWVVVLIVVLLVFGTGKLRDLGADLGKVVKDFRKATREREDQERASSGQAVPARITKSTASDDEGL